MVLLGVRSLNGSNAVRSAFLHRLKPRFFPFVTRCQTPVIPSIRLSACPLVCWTILSFFFFKRSKSIILPFDYNIMRSAVVVLLSLSSIALADSACPARSTVTVTEYEQLYETATKVAAADVKSSCTRSTTTTTTTEKVYVSQVQRIPKHQPWTNWGSTIGHSIH